MPHIWYVISDTTLNESIVLLVTASNHYDTNHPDKIQAGGLLKVQFYIFINILKQRD